MTPELIATLCDHAQGNPRALMNIAGELLAIAAQRYQASLAIMARLAKADLGNAGWQRDLSVTYVRLADFYKKSGRNSDARKALATARVIMARLVAQYPQQAKLKQEFAWFDAEAER
jgi:hypothetical protein